MASCANCQRHIPEDPNELDKIVECKFCDGVLCSEDCVTEHEEQAHAGEAVALPDEEEQPR